MQTPNLSPNTIAARATGAIFFAAFGSLWLCSGLAATRALNAASGLIAAAIAAALIWPASRLIDRFSDANTGAQKSEAELRDDRAFHRINAAQWIAIVATVVLLNVVGQTELLVSAIATIVGLHLFPLARLFHYRAHYVTGALLVVWSVGCAKLLPTSSIASTSALGAAAILLLSSAYTLACASSAARLIAAASEPVDVY